MPSKLKKYMYKIYIYILINHKMSTKKKYMKPKSGGTRKLCPCLKGGNNDQPCDNNNKCPKGFRCINRKCKGSQDINLSNNDLSIKLTVPWVRHTRWLEYINTLNENIEKIISIKNKKFTRETLKDMNSNLMNQVKNKSNVESLKGASNNDELIIVNVILTEIIRTENIDNREPEPNTEENNDNREPTEKQEDKNENVPIVEEDKQDIEEEVSIEIEKVLQELQDKVGILSGNVDSKEYHTKLLQNEKTYSDFLEKHSDYDFLYPELDDPNFNIKIAKKKEFNDTQYDGTVYSVKEHAEKMCNKNFELMPHQMFVKNFLSVQTPYNSLLLYHGLGTGKTCSAIGIAEEMRSYNKNIGSIQKIIIVASPNVQNNFRLQLFDERKLELEGDVWNLNTCIGNELLKELNPVQLQHISKTKIIAQINAIINQNYLFKGYGEFASYIKKHTMVDDDLGLSLADKKTIETEKIQKLFNNRLIIIDEVHNISSVQSNNKNKNVSLMLMHVCKYAENLRLLMLSATPMYNNYREIIWLTNLLNIVDKRALIREEDVFDKNGDFIQTRTTEDGRVIEGGKELLKRKLTGYVSYLKGENPYTFPYRIYPEMFDKGHTLQGFPYPKTQMNKKPIESGLKHIPVYVNSIGHYQEDVYNYIINNLQNKNYNRMNLKGENINLPDFENMESFGYTLLSTPIQALNIVYPNSDFNADSIQDTPVDNDDKLVINDADNIEKESEIIKSMIGTDGLTNIMTHEKTTTPYLLRHKFDYKPETIEKYGAIFSPDLIGKYSKKIENICNIIKKSKGIIMIYSQYLNSGVVPMALALEEMGFSRTGHANYTKSLFKRPPTDSVDYDTMENLENYSNKERKFTPAKYMMITGDKFYSPNNLADLKIATESNNKYGQNVKVILITKAAAEGLDFKNIRQLHIMDPWYNSSRFEQIIGRTVRNLSHCNLPFEERNVEIYLHCSYMNEDIECSDLYVYRYAESKAIQIGKVSRILKESAVDCILNIGQTNLTLEKLNEQSNGQEFNIQLSSLEDDKTVKYQIGDKPYTELCDYMDSCNYVCNPNANIDTDKLVKSSSYNEQFAKINYPVIVQRIRQLYKEQHFYKRDDLIHSILAIRKYPIEHIDYALSLFVNNKSEYVIDKYGRYGYLTNKDDIYAFQPFEITDEYASLYERSSLVDKKHSNLDIELPTIKNHKYQQLETDTKNNKTDTNNDSFESIIEKLKNNIDNVNLERQNKLNMDNDKSQLNSINKNDLLEMRNKYKLNDSSNYDWYKNAGLIYDVLNKKYHISEEVLLKIFVHHYLDTLHLKQHLEIVNNLYKLNSIDISYYNLIKSYYDKNIMTENNKKSILLPSYQKAILFIYNDETQMWIEAEPTNYTYFKTQIIKKFAMNIKNINEIFGFMYHFKNNISFKVKNLTHDKNNTGATCDKLGKTDIHKRLIPILQENPHNIIDWKQPTNKDFDKLLKPGLCVLLECILRFFNEAETNKIWFLDATQTLSNQIINK